MPLHRWISGVHSVRAPAWNSALESTPLRAGQGCGLWASLSVPSCTGKLAAQLMDSEGRQPAPYGWLFAELACGISCVKSFTT